MRKTLLPWICVILFIAATADAQWTAQYTTTSVLNSVNTLTDKAAFVVGDGVLGGTSNYGTNWTVTAEASATTLYDVSFLSSTEGYIAGANSKVLRVTHEAASGNFYTNTLASSPGATVTIQGCSFFDQSNGWVAGVDGATGVIYKFNGAAWGLQKSVAGVNFKKIAIARDGTSWGLAVGSDSSGGSARKVVYRTTDGGTTWSEDSPAGAGSGSFNAVHVAGADDAWVAGDGGNIYYYLSGTGWVDKSLSENVSLEAVRFSTQNDGLVAGRNGKAYSTGNGQGASPTWTAIGEFDASYDYVSIGLHDENNIWVLGKKGSGSIIYRQTAGPSISSLTPATINASTDAFTTTLTVEGDRFLQTPTAAFAKSGGSAGVNVNSVSFVNTQRIELTVRISPEAGGLYDLRLTNPDGGVGTSEQILTVNSAMMRITNIKIEGLPLQNSAASIVRKFTGGPTIYCNVDAPGTDLTQFNVTGEVTIGATRDAITARLNISASMATLESYSFPATLEVGSYEAIIDVYVGDTRLRERFTLTVASLEAQFKPGYSVTNIITTVAAPNTDLTIQLDSTNPTELAASELLIFGGIGPTDVYHVPIKMIDPVRNVPGVSAAAAGTTRLKVTIHFPDLGRGLYGAYFKNAAGHRISPIVRVVQAKRGP